MVTVGGSLGGIQGLEAAFGTHTHRSSRDESFKLSIWAISSLMSLWRADCHCCLAQLVRGQFGHLLRHRVKRFHRRNHVSLRWCQASAAHPVTK